MVIVLERLVQEKKAEMFHLRSDMLIDRCKIYFSHRNPLADVSLKSKWI